MIPYVRTIGLTFSGKSYYMKLLFSNNFCNFDEESNFFFGFSYFALPTSKWSTFKSLVDVLLSSTRI